MSGCPIFREDNETVIGIGVSSFKSTVVEFETVIVQEDGSEYREQRLRVEEFGFAHAVAPLLDWAPDCFDGLTVHEASNL